MSTDECGKRVRSVRSTPAILYGTLAVFMAMSLAGCRSVRETDALPDSSDEVFADVAALVGGLQQYANANGALPGSKEALQDFCSKGNLRCATLDWGKFSWKTVTDGSIAVTYEGHGYSLPITMTIGPASGNESGQVEGELMKHLRRRLEE